MVFPGILQTSSFPWRSDNGYLFSIVTEVSGESHSNLTRTIKGTLGLKWLLRKSHTLAPGLRGTAASGALLPGGQLCVHVAGTGDEPFASCSLTVCKRMGALNSDIIVHNSS